MNVKAKNMDTSKNKVAPLRWLHLFAALVFSSAPVHANSRPFPLSLARS